VNRAGSNARAKNFVLPQKPGSNAVVTAIETLSAGA